MSLRGAVRALRRVDRVRAGWRLCWRHAQPNIVVIVTDDQGYADISLNPHHLKEVSTPHMDALARDGVFFLARLRQRQRVHTDAGRPDASSVSAAPGVYTAGDGGRGFEPTIPIFPALLPEQYVSMAVGKWHLGLDDDYPRVEMARNKPRIR